MQSVSFPTSTVSHFFLTPAEETEAQPLSNLPTEPKQQQVVRPSFHPSAHSLITTTGTNYTGIRMRGPSVDYCSKASEIHRPPTLKETEANRANSLSLSHRARKKLTWDFNLNLTQKKPSCCIYWAELLERLGQSKCPVARKQSLVVAKVPSSHTEWVGRATNLSMMEAQEPKKEASQRAASSKAVTSSLLNTFPEKTDCLVAGPCWCLF